MVHGTTYKEIKIKILIKGIQVYQINRPNKKIQYKIIYAEKAFTKI